MDVSKTADFCRNFPHRPTLAVSRQSLLEHVATSTGPSSRVVFVEGGALSGKSVLLADYMLANPLNTVAVFLSPGDNYFYTADYVKLALYEQMYWIVNSVQANNDRIDDTEFTRMLLQLQKKARHKSITFLIDGLNESPSSDSRITKEILDVFPFSQNEFRFVLSGSAEFLGTLDLGIYKPKHAPLLPIGTDEAKAYFADCIDVSPRDIERIRHFCRGVIGQLARFKDLILSGVPVSKLLDEKEGNLRKILEFEWGLAAEQPTLVEILGYLAFSTQPLDFRKLSSLTGSDVSTIAAFVKKCRFAEIDDATKVVSVRSEEERRFIREQLHHVKNKFLEHFVSELLKNPESDEAVRNLPGKLLDIGRHGDLIARLDEEHFVRLLGTEKSLRALKRHCSIGYAASKLSRNEAAEVRFALTNSVITDLTFSVGTKSEIEARIKLGERETAIALALSAPTSEERLQLLATAAKAFEASNLLVPHELKQQIKTLVSDIDVPSLGNLARDIACDLLGVDFSLAMEIFEKSVPEDVQAATSPIRSETESAITEGEEPSESSSTFGKVHSRLSEHHRQRLADAVATMFERSSAENLLARFKSIPAKYQLFIAKQWLNRRRRDAGAWKIADYALNLTLGDPSRPPRIQDFREISVALPHISDHEQSDRIVKRIKAQLATELSHGTNVESVRLRMTLIRATYANESEANDAALIDLFSEIYEIKEVSIRAACWAWMLYGLQKLEDPEAVDGRTTVVTEITTKLIESIEQLLELSADHYETAKNALYALARTNPVLALQLVEKLNTSSRRDKALFTLAQELVLGRAYIEKPGLLLSCIKRIEAESTRDTAVLRCLSQIAKNSERGDPVSSNMGILGLWRSPRVAIRKFAAGVSTYRILAATGCDTSASTSLAAELDSLWPDVMVDFIRTDSGFALVRDLATANRELSMDWLEKVTNERRQSKIPSKALSDTLYLTVKLAIASFSAYAPKECDANDPQFSRLAFLIDSVPVPEFRMILWCDLGINLHYRNKRGISRMICSDYVQPSLQEEFRNNEAVKDILTEIAAPLLYLNHPPSASILVGKINDLHVRETAYSDICRTIFRKRSINEPYKKHESPGYELDSEDVASILDVLGNIETDSNIFSIVVDLCESLAAKKNNTKIRRAQVRDFLMSIDDLVEKKLPDQRNIKHTGYKIACKSNILKVRSTFETVNAPEWEALYNDACAIANVADRVVVITMIGVCAKSKGPFADGKWLNFVKSHISAIPSDFDRIDRYSWIAELLESYDKQQAVLLLREAMSLSNHLDDETTAFEKQKRILDLAHNIDESLVDKIIDLADKDEAKASTKERYLEHIKLKDDRKELAADPSNFDLNSITPDELARICRDNQAALAGGRIYLRPVEVLERSLRRLRICQCPWPFRYGDG